jgi:hypothetical protein
MGSVSMILGSPARMKMLAPDSVTLGEVVGDATRALP